ncbi:HEAT repeat domain-containing protein [Acidithiobacillus sulfuriphilus]|uniref:HEAT repeat domain-containing protein n=1 Tax=Acidithiobacillus sulfuriphilus TaxID=1867749 RepID=UPI003F62B31D
MRSDVGLTSSDPDIRRLAVINAIELDEQEALVIIIAGLQDVSSDVRAEAARAIAEIPGEHMLVPLLKLLDDDNQDVRNAAADTLAECNQESLLKIYEEWIGRDSPFVRASVLRAIKPLRIQSAAVYALNGLEDQSEYVRLESAGVLGYLQDPAYLPYLAKVASTDKSADVRRTAMGALGYSLCPETLSAVIQGLKDEAWQVRAEAAVTIAKLQAAEASKQLIQLIGAELYWQVIAKALVALGKVKSREAVGAVGNMLFHSESNVRKEAAICLGEIGDPRAIGSLREALMDRDPDVKKLAAWAIAKIDT